MEKHREFNTPIYSLFINYVKAFYKINRSKLWKLLNKKGIPLHLINVI